jgi:multiple sugar transport system permease protein/alpha-1,4-digalacturonate transport system permease protein
VDGAGEWAIFRRIALPLARPLIATLIIFTFMWRWNEFAWPLIVLKDTNVYTLPIGLLFLKGQYATDVTALMSIALLAIVPVAVVFLLFQRAFIEGVLRSGIK